MTGEPVKVSVLLDSEYLRPWSAAELEGLLDSSSAEIEMLLIDGSMDDPSEESENRGV